VQTVLGKYEIRAKISKGPMSAVYDGWDTAIDRRVAIKAVPLAQTGQSEGWQHLTRFKREAQAAGRLQHPSVVAIFDYGETAESAFIVMEFIDGGTLKSALETGTRFTIQEINRLMQDVLAGLQYSHDRGIVHRDIKPANIMLTGDGHAKIADFGIARVEHSDITQVGMIMGTPAYMSPEQFRGEALSPSTDIYSAGVILYQLLTSERPFDGGLATIMHKALSTEPPKPSDISRTAPRSVDDVVARAMAKQPERRFRDAKGFAQALRDALAVKQADPRCGPWPPGESMGRRGAQRRRRTHTLSRERCSSCWQRRAAWRATGCWRPAPPQRRQAFNGQYCRSPKRPRRRQPVLTLQGPVPCRRRCRRTSPSSPRRHARRRRHSRSPLRPRRCSQPRTRQAGAPFPPRWPIPCPQPFRLRACRMH